jgi:hypothetical protein
MGIGHESGTLPPDWFSNAWIDVGSAFRTSTTVAASPLKRPRVVTRSPLPVVWRKSAGRVWWVGIGGYSTASRQKKKILYRRKRAGGKGGESKTSDRPFSTTVLLSTQTTSSDCSMFWSCWMTRGFCIVSVAARQNNALFPYPNSVCSTQQLVLSAEQTETAPNGIWQSPGPRVPGPSDRSRAVTGIVNGGCQWERRRSSAIVCKRSLELILYVLQLPRRLV